jgi:hypothetical protein
MKNAPSGSSEPADRRAAHKRRSPDAPGGHRRAALANQNAAPHAVLAICHASAPTRSVAREITIESRRWALLARSAKEAGVVAGGGAGSPHRDDG